MKDKDPNVRRCQRVLAMLLELHKRGYQNLALYSGMSPSGMYWRCEIVPYDSVSYREDGYLKIEPGLDEYKASYSSGDSNLYFQWEDARTDTARQLADKFEARFVDLCRRGAGFNYPYSGWLIYAVGIGERGNLPVMYSEYSDYGQDRIGSTGGEALASPPHPRQPDRTEAAVKLSTKAPGSLFIVPDQPVKQFSAEMESCYECLHRVVARGLQIPDAIDTIIGLRRQLKSYYYSMRDYLEADDGISQEVPAALPEFDLTAFLKQLHSWEEDYEIGTQEYEKRDISIAAAPFNWAPSELFSDPSHCWKEYRLWMFECNRILYVAGKRIADDAPPWKPKRYDWI